MNIENICKYSIGFFLIIFISYSGALLAENSSINNKNSFSFEGPLGTFDRSDAQRGLQIFVEICSSCHSLKHVTYRNLSDLGYDKKQISQFAAQFEVLDGPNQEGEMFTRSALPSDKFVRPFANDEEAKIANNGALPPDLSLIVKARHVGLTISRHFYLDTKKRQRD